MKHVSNTDSIKGRIKLYAEKEAQIEMAAFERKAGLASGTMSRVNVQLSTMNLVKIAQAFPEMNMTWVLTGLGDMSMKKEPVSVNNEGNANQVANNVYNMTEVKNIAVKTVCDEVKSLNRIIEGMQKEKDALMDANKSLHETNRDLHEENLKQLEINRMLIEKI